MTNYAVFLAVICGLTSHAFGMGCIEEVCRGRDTSYRTCYLANTKLNPSCGRYMSTRWSGQILKAVDLHCDKFDEVVAPFDARVRYYAPYGDGTRWDTGMKFKGLGQWEGYEATIIHIKPKITSGVVKQGQVVGNAISILEDAEDSSKLKLSKEVTNNFIQLAMKRDGKVIDPTGHLFDCSCTGQICETNPKNDLVGDYKATTDYTGFELTCPNKMPLQKDGTVPESVLPAVYSPIQGNRIGRLRTRDPTDKGVKYPCAAEGVFITGAGKVWQDYEARIYNVKFTEAPGEKEIKVGDKIAERLECDGKISTIAVELRFKGQLVNFKPQITANNCTMPHAVQKKV